MVVSTELWLAITRNRRSFQSCNTGGLLRGSGYGTICKTTSVMWAANRCAKIPACFQAASVASTEVNTTLISRAEVVSLGAAGVKNFSMTGEFLNSTTQRRLKVLKKS